VTLSSLDNPAPICNNVASEKAVLAGIIQHGIDAFADVQSIIEEATFTIDGNKVVYQCLKKALKTTNKIDLTSILSAAKQLNLEDYVENPAALKHLKHIMNYDIVLDNVRTHAIKLKRLQFARDLRTAQHEIFLALGEVDGDEQISDILNIPETKTQDVALRYIREDRSVPKLIGANIDDYTEKLETQGVRMPGVSTGYPCFDKAIGGGLRRGCVDLIGSRAKTGKSTLADNISIYVGSPHDGAKSIPILLIDTEMNEEDHYDRLLANLSGVPINKISTSEYSKKTTAWVKISDKEKKKLSIIGKEEWLDITDESRQELRVLAAKFFETPDLVEKVKVATEKIKKLNYHYINVAGSNFEETLSVIRRWLFKNVGYDKNGRMKDCVVIYDYLKMMSSNDINKNVAEFQALGFQITQLHNFTVEYDFPCLAFVQLNREGITKETEDAISGSDRLIWLCSSFSIFKKKTQEEIAQDTTSAGNRKLINVVARHGPGSEGYICMLMTGDLSRVEELGLIGDFSNDGVPDREDADSEEEGELQD